MSVAAALLLFSGSNALAQADLTCSDIEWDSTVTNRYPGIENACYDVVERNGEVRAKVKVQVLDMSSNEVSFRFVQPDGTLSDVYQTALSPEWATAIRGVKLDSGAATYGMTMNAYVPSDRWEVIYDEENAPNLAGAAQPYEEDLGDAPESVEVRSSVSESESTADIDPSPVMPVTAGPLPLVGLLGAGVMALGGAIRLFRRRFL